MYHANANQFSQSRNGIGKSSSNDAKPQPWTLQSFLQQQKNSNAKNIPFGERSQ